ncbi:MAG: hypothetical protein JWN65_2411 [Solirubrobacterales bacterium]|nr:hypothetical protein [Solirubrobacterales bacterium]
MEDQGTPARDHHGAEEFEKHDDAVSDQQGETAPPHADEPKHAGEDEHAADRAERDA